MATRIEGSAMDDSELKAQTMPSLEVAQQLYRPDPLRTGFKPTPREYKLQAYFNE